MPYGFGATKTKEGCCMPVDPVMLAAFWIICVQAVTIQKLLMER
jgi:hypothetical protein